MNSVPDWETFIKDHLLTYRVVSGVVLMTRHSVPVYTYGQLEDVKQEELAQYPTIFRFADNEKLIEKLYEKDFYLTEKSGKKVTYKVFQRTYCSMYATSGEDNKGLAICNLPYGILICTYEPPVQASQAVKIVEQFCDLLRA